MHRFTFVATVGLSLSFQALAQTAISFETPRAAYLALSKDPHAKLKRNAEGWEIVHVSAGPNEGVWTFAPSSHSSFPSVVKQQVVEREGALFVAMDALCGGEKPACDQYIAGFVKRNEQMSKEINEMRTREKGSQ